jgi:hypothetical protein
MRPLLAVVLAVACVLGSSTLGFARDGGHSGAIVRDPTILVAPAPQAPILNPIPAPLPPPAQAPTVNGPISQPAFRGLSGIGQ